MLPVRSQRVCSACIWVGDLNYRFAQINYTHGGEAYQHTRLPTHEIKEAANSNQLQKLLAWDEVSRVVRAACLNVQLRTMRSLRWAFAEYDEAPITFQPTYKYDTGPGNVWDT
jgi:endonuclease/exonuclease/phosphatase family metal-dependent hydrolase